MVLEDNKLKWFMYSNSEVTSKKVSVKVIHNMLRNILLAANDGMPRGPKVYKNGNLTYLSSVIGDYNSFEGLEKILLKNHNVYHGRFEGGMPFYSGKSLKNTRKH